LILYLHAIGGIDFSPLEVKTDDHTPYAHLEKFDTVFRAEEAELDRGNHS